MTRNWRLLAVSLLASLVLTGCFGKKKQRPEVGTSAEPDKVLYDRAMEDIRKSHYEVGRLTLQALMNTYPDSEYLAKAKLAIADSYYKEGGTSGLTQAVAEYKDFITFFPFLDEAAYAQMQVGMAHYRRLEKPDRDRTEARLAEQEYQVFLQKYPNNPLAPQAEQRLREVQELLAEGDFRIARFYYIKGAQRAAAARLIELTNRYPLYSRADEANWMLAGVFEKNEKNEIAAQYYARIVRDYPLSDRVAEAKEKLIKVGVPIPQPNTEALARMQREREYERERPGLLRRSFGMFKSGPDVSTAARSGKPNLEPPPETTAQVLTPTGSSSVGGGTSGGTGTAVVETVTPGTGSTVASPTTTTASSNASGNPSSGSNAPSSENPPKADSSNPDAKPAADAAKPADSDKKDAKKDAKKNKKESSSKKKKGLRKIIPW